MEGTTQLTNWISWALDVVLDNLLRILNALWYLIIAPFQYAFSHALKPMFSYGSGAKFTQGECILYHELKLEVFR